MSALKEPERITLAEGLKLLESHLPAEEAKDRLRQAFIRRALTQSEVPLFTLPCDKAEIDWATGSVKIPGTRRFCPTFGRTEFNSYFFNEHIARRTFEEAIGAMPPIGRHLAGEEISKEAHKDPLITNGKHPELFTLKLGAWGVHVDLKELFRRAKAWWKRKK